MDTHNTVRFLQKYFDALTLHGDLVGDYWQTILHSIRTYDSIKHSEYATLERILNQELDKLDNEELLALYKESENGGWLEKASDDTYSIELIKIELVEELMDQITAIAWEQATNSQ